MLCDFETSKLLHEPSASVTFVVATPLYTDPAVLRGECQHSKASDLYSMGVMFCEILAGEIPKNLSNVRESLSLPNESNLDLLQLVIVDLLFTFSRFR